MLLSEAVSRRRELRLDQGVQLVRQSASILAVRIDDSYLLTR